MPKRKKKEKREGGVIVVKQKTTRKEEKKQIISGMQHQRPHVPYMILAQKEARNRMEWFLKFRKKNSESQKILVSRDSRLAEMEISKPIAFDSLSLSMPKSYRELIVPLAPFPTYSAFSRSQQLNFQLTCLHIHAHAPHSCTCTCTCTHGCM